MKMPKIIIWAPLLIIPFCSVFIEQKTEQKPYVMKIPKNFPEPIMDPENPLTEEGIALGKELFFDTRLSGNSRISCASCHLPEKAFSDGLVTSVGISGIKLTRNSPSLLNLAWTAAGFFWDGGSETLESQAYGPITHPDEMGMDLDILLKRLKSDPIYVKQFRAAFDDTIRTQYIVKALAQFERSLIAAESRYDRYNNGDTAALTQTEKLGMSLVKKHCSSCHAGELFTDQKFHNIGLDSDFSDERDEGVRQGRYRITFKEEDKGKYKTPTLRNIAITAPYMHDGRFNSLEKVLEHYQTGIKNSPSLDPIFVNNDEQTGIPLTAKEKKAIISFLGSLTDSRFRALK